MQLSDVADRLVKARLQSLAGVGSAGVFGERRFAMRAWVQPAQLSARGLSVQDVESASAARNVEIPAGRIESTRREFSVRSLGELKTPREFGEMVVTSQGGQVVKLKDVAHVELGPEDTRSIFRYNGIPAVAIGVVRQSKANLIDVAQRIREAIPGIQQTLPPGIKLETAFDGSVFVTHSINDARLTLLIAAILVVLIRSEEHTSELQSLAYLVCRLLLEKKKNKSTGVYVVSTLLRLVAARTETESLR